MKSEYLRSRWQGFFTSWWRTGITFGEFCRNLSFLFLNAVAGVRVFTTPEWKTRNGKYWVQFQVFRRGYRCSEDPQRFLESRTGEQRGTFPPFPNESVFVFSEAVCTGRSVKICKLYSVQSNWSVCSVGGVLYERKRSN